MRTIQSAEQIMVLLYCAILLPFLIAMLFIRWQHRKLDREEVERLRNQVWSRCSSCGFNKVYDSRELTLTECPDCGAPVHDDTTSYRLMDKESQG